MSVLEAIVLGVVQGLAEFLPVSSSGHLQIAKEILGVELADDLTFDIALHVATVLATVVVLWREVRGLFAAKAAAVQQAGSDSADRSEVSVGKRWIVAPDWVMNGKLALSAVPVAVVGLVFRDRLNAILSSPGVLLVVGASLIATAGMLWLSGRVKARENEITTGTALAMGVAQSVAAIFPGLSRSGTTIATGLLVGARRARAAQFSFLMIIAPILGEAVLDLARGNFNGEIELVPLMAGFAAAFVVGCVACRWMIELVKRARLGWFAAYCAVVGAATVIYYFAK